MGEDGVMSRSTLPQSPWSSTRPTTTAGITEVFTRQSYDTIHKQSGHQGIERKVSFVRSRIYWTGMYADISE